MTNLAIIGMDANIESLTGMDAVERAIYQGQRIDRASGQPPIQQSFEQTASNSVEQLLCATGLSAEAINLILIQPEHTQPENSLIELSEFAGFHTNTLVTNLPEALMLAANQVRSSHYATAIVGVNLESEGNEAANSFAWDAEFTGYHKASGVASVLISSQAFAETGEHYIYAHISGLNNNFSMEAAAAVALQQAHVHADDIGYLEVTGSAVVSVANTERRAMANVFRAESGLTTAVGCAQTVCGDAGPLARMLGLLKSIISVQQRYIPGIDNWKAPNDNALEASSLYLPTESRPWYPNPSGKNLTAAYSCQTADEYCFIVLHEDKTDSVRANGYMATADLSLFFVSGNTQAAMQQQLSALEASIANAEFKNLSRDTYAQFQQEQHMAYHACLLAEGTDELIKEITLAKAGVDKAFADNGEWKTPKGSYFSANPMRAGSQAADGTNAPDIAFMYPGIGATYVGLGRELFHLFPAMYEKVHEVASDMANNLKDEILNPRSRSELGFKDIKALDHDLRNSLPDIAECGVGFACVFTKIFEDVFKVKADYATGYSMGEISMYAALGCWQDPAAMSKRLAASETFNRRLNGELLAPREHWGLDEAKEGIDSKNGDKIWETYTIKATAEEVAAASEDEDRVYCTIINTPDSLLVAGFPEACERVIKKLGVRAMPLDMPNAIHSPPAYLEYAHMEALYTLDVSDRIDTKMYSSSCYLPVPQRTKAIANSIARCLCDPVDFPRLINTMYDKGARIFIEMGPGRSLSSWVDKTLKTGEHKPHVSLPVNAKGTADELTFMRAIAKMVSHGVPMDLAHVFHGSLIVSKASTHAQTTNNTNAAVSV